MILEDKLIEELTKLEEETYKITQNRYVTESQLEEYLKCLERRRYNILNKIKVYNSIVKNENEKVKTINDSYKADIYNNILRIYIPETMPTYKNLKTHAYKNILLNIIDKTKQFEEMFKKEIFIYIKVFDNIKNWDIDNKFIKVIPDALILSGVIKDDNIDKCFYCVKGEFSEVQHTEVFVLGANEVINFLENVIA